MDQSVETDRRQLLSRCTPSSQVEQQLGAAAAAWATGTYTGDYASDGHADIRYQTVVSDDPADGGVVDQLMDIRSTTYYDDNGNDGLRRGRAELRLPHQARPLSPRTRRSPHDSPTQQHNTARRLVARSAHRLRAVGDAHRVVFRRAAVKPNGLARPRGGPARVGRSGRAAAPPRPTRPTGREHLRDLGLGRHEWAADRRPRRRVDADVVAQRNVGHPSRRLRGPPSPSPTTSRRCGSKATWPTA